MKLVVQLSFQWSIRIRSRTLEPLVLLRCFVPTNAFPQGWL